MWLRHVDRTKPPNPYNVARDEDEELVEDERDSENEAQNVRVERTGSVAAAFEQTKGPVKRKRRQASTTRQKGDDTLQFYTGVVHQVLVVLILRLRRQIACEDAFPCSLDFGVTTELIFTEEARSLANGDGESHLNISSQRWPSFLTVAELDGPMQFTAGIKSLVSNTKKCGSPLSEFIYCV